MPYPPDAVCQVLPTQGLRLCTSRTWEVASTSLTPVHLSVHPSVPPSLSKRPRSASCDGRNAGSVMRGSCLLGSLRDRGTNNSARHRAGARRVASGQRSRVLRPHGRRSRPLSRENTHGAEQEAEETAPRATTGCCRGTTPEQPGSATKRLTPGGSGAAPGATPAGPGSARSARLVTQGTPPAAPSGHNPTQRGVSRGEHREV